MEDWKKELEDLDKQEQEEREEERLIVQADAAASELNMEAANEFLSEKVEPAFSELGSELKKYAKKAWWDGGTLDRHLHVQLKNGAEATYTIQANVDKRTFTAQKRFSVRNTGTTAISSPPFTNLPIDLSKVTKDNLISDFMADYKNWKRSQR